jgi:hypothetical protein
MNIQEIRAELDKVNAQIETLDFDNNGNALDREFADKLFTREAELFDMLMGKGVKSLNLIITE